jgi:hypothetical protein
MSKQLEVPVEAMVAGEYVERIIIVTDYTYHPARRAVLNRAPEDCEPGEPASVDDIVCKWEDTDTKLSDEEFDQHQEEMENSIFDNLTGDYDD